MRRWTQKERLKQSNLIRNWCPWNKSTGAKTSEGKEISKMNAYKNGWHTAEVRAIKRQFAEYDRQLNSMQEIVDNMLRLEDQFHNNLP